MLRYITGMVPYTIDIYRYGDGNHSFVYNIRSLGSGCTDTLHQKIGIFIEHEDPIRNSETYFLQVNKLRDWMSYKDWYLYTIYPHSCTWFSGPPSSKFHVRLIHQKLSYETLSRTN